MSHSLKNASVYVLPPRIQQKKHEASSFSIEKAIQQKLEHYRKNRIEIGTFTHKIFEQEIMPSYRMLSLLDDIYGFFYGLGHHPRNHSEMNVICDYSLVYTVNYKGMRYLEHYLSYMDDLVNDKNKAVVDALKKSWFTVLRIDERFESGALKVFDLLKEKHYTLMDIALSASTQNGWYIVTTVLDLKKYIMTSGAAIPIKPESHGGQAMVTLFQNYKKELATQTIRPMHKKITPKYVREIYSYALIYGTLSGHTINQIS